MERQKPRSRRLMASLLAIAALSWMPGRALAGGFYLLPRGVRAAAQGGAVVAGSDDPGALWYNPAGLAYSGRQALADFLLPIQTIHYTRINGGGEVEPTVSSTSTPLPIPGFGYSDHFGLRRLTFGIGVMAPTAALHNWPRTIVDRGERIAAPQRYSLISMTGSGFGNLALGAAYRPSKYVSLGAAFNAVVGRFVVDVALSLCDQALLCSNPEAGDAAARISVPSDGFPFLVRPGGAFGVVIDLADKAPVRIGLSATTGFSFRGEAKLDVQIPQQGAYRGATLSNDRAAFEVRFPWIYRAGIEVRPVAPLRLEIQGTYEGWSVQNEMKVRPKDVTLRALLDSQRVPTLEIELGALDMPRGMRDVWAVGLGGELTVAKAWMVRLGAMVERSAFDDAHFSIVTPDTDKLLLAVGASWAVSDTFSLDLTAGHAFMRDRQVACTKVFQPYPLRPALPEPTCAEQKALNAGQRERGTEAVPLANGDYALDAWFVGLGVRFRPRMSSSG
jgi:long-chain fatty acid transport protein